MNAFHISHRFPIYLSLTLEKITRNKLIIFTPPMVPGFSISGGVEFKLEDKTGGGIKKFEQISHQFLSALNQRPEIQYAYTSFNTEELLKYGSATYIEVLNAQQNLLSAELSDVNDHLQQLNAVVSLYRALGGGWE